ncbi:MAG TPA: hypothetical protein PKB02_18940 [Anaerohalosphaeraceae bacterium]|nr:hypothetical protein [Anaerohalosphaeraceae bacterium]
MPIHPQERLLQQVFGVLPAAGPLIQKPEQPRRIHLHKPRKAVRAAGLGCTDQVIVYGCFRRCV